MTWLILITFMFPGVVGPTVTQRDCPTMACIAETEDMAERDPFVIRYEVLRQGEMNIGRTTLHAPLIDGWKS